MLVSPVLPTFCVNPLVLCKSTSDWNVSTLLIDPSLDLIDSIWLIRSDWPLPCSTEKKTFTGLEAAEEMKRIQTEHDKNRQTTNKSAEELEREFSSHIGKNHLKREKEEKLRIRKERMEAVRKAEKDLLMSEEQRNLR